MVVGHDDPHLFLTLRHQHDVFENYVLDTNGEGDDGERSTAVIALLRRVVIGAGGHFKVEMLDVTGSMPSRQHTPAPGVTLIALSLLNSPIAERFSDYLHRELSLVLVDLPLGRHLEVWLAEPGSRFRYAVIRTEAQGRVVPLLVGLFESGDARSHLLLRPLSHAAVGIFRAAFAELDPAEERIVADPEVLELQPELLHLGLSHLIGEEVRFSASWASM